MTERFTRQIHRVFAVAGGVRQLRGLPHPVTATDATGAFTGLVPKLQGAL
jgi:hypothetical protein